MNRVLLLSYWRNDEHRQIRKRILHLLGKLGVHQWVWIVGDSDDKTEDILREYATDSRVHVFRRDSNIAGEDIDSRRLRISLTETLAYAELERYSDIDYVVQHESDLLTSPSVVLDLLAYSDMRTVVAGWPIIQLHGDTLFYDTWAYRGLDRERFQGVAPFHKDYRADQPFEVSSVGSVWMAPMFMWRHRVILKDCCVELCEQWKAQDYRVLVVPTIIVEQPRDLWVAS
jgi:hypothetical protein